ncbi:hypothetical protein [Helicobacter suis]|uniref:hypothetical protein n=1 Tax=Helicobacter suis TaxID=104628 RepID=UPI0013D43098|nr:hypothetical protein [Helicobacter suis]
MMQGRALDVLKQMQNASFDCIITSPPYNVGKDYEKRKSLEDYLQGFKLNKLYMPHCTRLKVKS